VTSRRLRFEILRRDNFTCRYCGASAPHTALAIDHVIPVVLGGGDDPTNLVTACIDCNAGKTSMPADAALVAEVDATAMLFARAMERAAVEARARIADEEALLADFDDEWTAWKSHGQVANRDGAWRASVIQWVSLGLNMDDLVYAIRKAMESQARFENVWKYFCGVCWQMIADRQERARRLIEDGKV